MGPSCWGSKWKRRVSTTTTFFFFLLRAPIACYCRVGEEEEEKVVCYSSSPNNHTSCVGCTFCFGSAWKSGRPIPAQTPPPRYYIYFTDTNVDSKLFLPSGCLFRREKNVQGERDKYPGPCVCDFKSSTDAEGKKKDFFGSAFVIGRTGFISIFSGRISPLFPFWLWKVCRSSYTSPVRCKWAVKKKEKSVCWPEFLRYLYRDVVRLFFFPFLNFLTCGQQ